MSQHDAYAEQRAYQHEKLCTAVRGLMPARPPSQDLAIAMHEAQRAFGHAPPPPGAEDAWQTLQTLMSTTGSWQEQACCLTDHEVHMFLSALWDLYEATTRAAYAR